MLKNKIAIVTGSSRGFGAAIAEELTHNGIKTVITYFDGDDKEKKMPMNYLQNSLVTWLFL